MLKLQEIVRVRRHGLQIYGRKIWVDFERTVRTTKQQKWKCKKHKIALKHFEVLRDRKKVVQAVLQLLSFTEFFL